MKGLCDQSLHQIGGSFPPIELRTIAQHVRKGEGINEEMDGESIFS
jgi:hypothetical protein